MSLNKNEMSAKMAGKRYKKITVGKNSNYIDLHGNVVKKGLLNEGTRQQHRKKGKDLLENEQASEKKC